jgi:hypothetical protein
VEVLRDLAALRPWYGAVEALNLASRRPNPFQSPRYLEIYAAHDEQPVRGAEPLLLLVLDGEVPVGFLALRRRPERVLGWAGSRLEPFVIRDCDRFGLVSRPEDEARCAAAAFATLVELEGWGLLELPEQDATSPLVPDPAVVPPSRFYVRRYPNNPNGTIPLAGGAAAWYRALGGDQRSKVARRARALLGAADVELVTSRDPAAAGALLDLYLEVEARSWKVAARAGVARHPERVAFFRALLQPPYPATPVFHFLLRRGLPIAAFLVLDFAGVAYGLEMAFDEAESEAAPGNVLTLLAVVSAAARGAGAFNMLGNYEYHKARWRAVVTETSAVQVFRRGSAHHLKAVAGDLRRRLAGARRSQRDVEFNLSRPHGEAAPPTPGDDGGALERAQATLARLGAGVWRASGSALDAILPFDLAPGRDAPGPPPRRRGQRSRGLAPAPDGSRRD